MRVRIHRTDVVYVSLKPYDLLLLLLLMCAEAGGVYQVELGSLTTSDT